MARTTVVRHELLPFENKWSRCLRDDEKDAHHIFRVNRPGESIASSGFGYDVEVARPDNFLVLLANAVTLHDVRDQVIGDPSGYANARGYVTSKQYLHLERQVNLLPNRFEDSSPLRLHVPSRGDTSTVFSRVVVVPGNSLAGEKARVSSGGCDFVTV
ncbi:hypothetical protein PM082_010175 [Marasmius tenuissimus]|nr:hypothetical protein PM082_010175 [Marasmius tenuissimus]